MTQLLHNLRRGDFEERLQLARFDYLERLASRRAPVSLENYAGLPADPGLLRPHGYVCVEPERPT